MLLKNVNPDHHHWVELKLVGGPKSPRDAVGATVYLTANGMRQREDVMSGGSYISSNDQRPHFGLGDATDAGTCGDSLAFRREGNGEAAGGGSDLYDHRGKRDHRRDLREATVCDEAGARRTNSQTLTERHRRVDSAAPRNESTRLARPVGVPDIPLAV